MSFTSVTSRFKDAYIVLCLFPKNNIISNLGNKIFFAALSDTYAHGRELKQQSETYTNVSEIIRYFV